MPERFPKGSPGDPANCPGWPSTSLHHTSPTARPVPARRPFTDNPTHLHRPARSPSASTSRPTRTPHNPSTTASASYPATTDCDLEVFNPSSTPAPRSPGDRLALGAQHRAQRTPVPRPRRLALGDQSGHRHPAAGASRSTPTPPTGRRPAADAQANFGSEAPAECPDQSKIGTFADRHPGAGRAAGRLPLHRRTEARRPVPPLPGRRRLRHPRQAARLLQARPRDRAADVPIFEDLPQVPFDDFHLHLFASDRGLMATPTPAPSTRPGPSSTPGTRRSPNRNRPRCSASTRARTATHCPGQVRPFHPRLVAGTSNPARRCLLLLHPQARSRRRRPVPRRPQLQDAARLHRHPARHHLLPRAPRSPPPPKHLGRAEQANPSCPASSQVGTTNVAAGPGSHPFHAVGKMYLAGPFKGAPLSSGRDHPRPGRAL